MYDQGNSFFHVWIVFYTWICFLPVKPFLKYVGIFVHIKTSTYTYAFMKRRACSGY